MKIRLYCHQKHASSKPGNSCPFLALTPHSTAAIDSLRGSFCRSCACTCPLRELRADLLLALGGTHFPLSHLAWYLTIFLWTLSTLFHRFSHLEAPHFHDVSRATPAEQPPCRRCCRCTSSAPASSRTRARGPVRRGIVDVAPRRRDGDGGGGDGGESLRRLQSAPPSVVRVVVASRRRRRGQRRPRRTGGSRRRRRRRRRRHRRRRRRRHGRLVGALVAVGSAGRCRR